MRKTLLTFILIVFSVSLTFAQWQTQYFDGSDTSAEYSLSIRIAPDSSNIWQIGSPHKLIFDSAATLPNAIMTDTAGIYPANTISQFEFTFTPQIPWGILALQWMQKLDMDAGHDGGIIEFSADAGTTWMNAFNNPYVYNFYGYQEANKDTLETGEYALSGTDSTWRDIWLCFDMSWIGTFDSILVRYTFKSDSVDNSKEGWIIDNMFAHLTGIHTVGEIKQTEYLKVYPNPAIDIIHIEAKKLQEFHIIEQMELINAQGVVVDRWKNIPTRFFIDSRRYSPGFYFLKIKTNIQSETFPVMISRE